MGEPQSVFQTDLIATLVADPLVHRERRRVAFRRGGIDQVEVAVAVLAAHGM